MQLNTLLSVIGGVLAVSTPSSATIIAPKGDTGLTPAQHSILQKRFDSYYASNNANANKVRGITLGGWLVTEPYITPTLYNYATQLMANSTHNTKRYNVFNSSIIDEYTMCQALGYETAENILAQHYDGWINETDFQQIAEDGFNLVRIPVGYWAWKQNHSTNAYPEGITFKDPYVGEGLQLRYLNKAIAWAEKYGLNVWLDLHGAPGSQNGFDNSGQRNFYDDLDWLRDGTGTWNLTLAIWRSMFDEYLNSSSAIVGVEVMNEPLSTKIDIWDITQAYYDAWRLFSARENRTANTTFVIHDAFEGTGHWNLEFNPKYTNVSAPHGVGFNSSSYPLRDSHQVLVDHHHYEVFTDWQLANTQYGRLMDIVNFGDSIAEQELQYHPAVVGEWSGAITDCAHWLNGVGVGARYDGSYYKTTEYTTDDKPVGTCYSQNPISQWNDTYKRDVRQFIEAQLATYTAQTTGWIFWNWKTETAYEWDYTQLKKAGLFPVPLDNYTYFGSDGKMLADVSASLSSEAYPYTSTKGSSSGSGTNTKTKTKSTKSHNGAAGIVRRGSTAGLDANAPFYSQTLSFVTVALLGGLIAAQLL
ncbi:glucan exo-1,3-beta-glucosidase [Maudiozyma humilis]|uniref:Glucan exo-1,3-beta-glucosidase n=1 Tax=Maudiozyma humilis TaxID=51915 RepID=A0AAV5RPV3_MAUHU|nr:glucan exo-1,3-beta-glucosidase [Kazachstania humilis]